MKRTLILLCIIWFSQVNAQTTMSEYKYVKEGFKIQQESGLDNKDGYVLTQSHIERVNYPNFKRTVDFRYLVRTNNGEIAAIQLVVKRTDTGYEQYICLPAIKSSSDIWNLAKTDFNQAFKDWTKPSLDYTWGFFRMISSQANSIKFEKSQSIKYLYATNGGVHTFMSNGTYGVCGRCDYLPAEIDHKSNRILDKSYKDFKNFIELEEGSRLEFFKEGVLDWDWRIFNGIIIDDGEY